jgi:phosphoribosylamine--glycine ligase
VSTDVLVVGSGAREHALAWKLRQSPRVGALYAAPGNPGTAQLAENLALDPFDFDGLAATVKERQIGLVVVGPEGPLAAGIADFLAARDVPVFGPTKAAAQIEASKSFAKRLMESAGIPTAAAAVFDDYDAAAAYVRELRAAPVIKADGLAAGKGVTVAGGTEEALAALHSAMMDGAFGASGSTVVVEDRLYGREVSAHAFSDGRCALPMPYACDHKAVYDGGRGPNTGGMGAFSPPGFIDEALHARIWSAIVEPLVAALAERGTPYRGTIYPGLMITESGPRVIEVNCRFGDPEAEVILPRLASDLFEPIWRAATGGDLSGVDLSWSSDACVGVVLAAEGYPGPVRRGDPIDGLDEVDPDVQVFHGGTAQGAGGALRTAGGRVLTVVGAGPTLQAARTRAYANAARIRFDGVHYRRDIGSEAR